MQTFGTVLRKYYLCARILKICIVMINLTGISSPRARNIHQLIITETLLNMHPEIKARRGWHMMYEATVTDNPLDNYPDIIVMNPKGELQFSLEITRNWGMSYDKRKGLMLKQRFPNAEFFIYNYERDILYGLGDDLQWYSSEQFELRSRLFALPILEYIYVPEDY